MLNSFEISKNADGKYDNKFSLNENLLFGYTHKNLFSAAEQDDKTIVCYGYCFDVRDPKTNISETLNDLLSDSENFEENLKYLNGHYVLVFNLNRSWSLVTDTVSMTPVYYDVDKQMVTAEDNSELPSLHGYLILNLNDFSLNRIEVPDETFDNDELEEIVLDAVKNQYKYFTDKDFSLNFRRNQMSKAIISILHPVLFGNALNLREQDNITEKVGTQLANEYRMNLFTDEESETLYMANIHLMNYTTFLDRKVHLSEEEEAVFVDNYKIAHLETDAPLNVEYNIMNRLRYRIEKKQHLMYDPFNVQVIQDRIYTFNGDESFDPFEQIIKSMHPAIDFYDFANGETLLNKYHKIRKINKKLLREAKKHKKNEAFLSVAKERGIEVSDNLDGNVMDDGITFYPALQNISKDDVFEVLYKKEGYGMVLFESYFDNLKNAHRIKVNLNGEQYNISEFFEGKIINIDSDILLKMTYERDYDAASWQKAGKITIKELS